MKFEKVSHHHFFIPFCTEHPGTSGFYWGSTQYGATSGWNMGFSNSGGIMSYTSWANGFTVRCLREN